MIRRLVPIGPVLLVLFMTGCLFHTRKVANHLSTAPLKMATTPELIGKVNSDAAQIQTMTATVDIRTSVGGQKKGKVTEYTEIRGYILAEKPAMLRMIGLFPIVRNRAFDMVSNGVDFKLSIPPKNKFIVGRNDQITPNPKQPLESIRPQHIYDALLLHEISPEDEIAVKESSMEEVKDPKSHKELQQPNYILDVIRRDEMGWYMARKIYFDRVDLTPYRQVVYDRQGNIATVADYSDFHDYSGVSFPNHIEITRPQEEYKIGLTIVSLKLNQPLTAKQFELNPPPGAQIQNLTTANDNTAQK